MYPIAYWVNLITEAFDKPDPLIPVLTNLVHNIQQDAKHEAYLTIEKLIVSEFKVDGVTK